MKSCPQCGRSYTDELSYCLSDGTQLVSTSEEPTVVRTRDGKKRSRGTNVLLVILAALLSLSLGITAAVLYFFWPHRDGAANNGVAPNVSSVNQPQRQESPTPAPQSPTPTPARTPAPTPTRERTPDEEAPPEITSDPGPARVTFARGTSRTSVSGAVVQRRSFVLYAAPGQQLRGEIDSGDRCAVFEDGSRRIRFATQAGDNLVTVVNECDRPARFSLDISIR